MADMKKEAITIAHKDVAEALEGTQTPKTLSHEVAEVFDNAFIALCEGKIANIELFADCPCKLKSTLLLGENEGGLEFDLRKCDLCDHDVADKQGREVSEMIHIMVRSWASSVGRDTLKGAVARKHGVDPSEIGVALRDDSKELVDKLNSQWRAMCVLAEMLNVVLTHPEVLKLEGMSEPIIDMSKTWGAIVAQFDLKPVPSKDGAVEEAEKIIDESRESEGGTDESN